MRSALLSQRGPPHRALRLPATVGWLVPPATCGGPLTLRRCWTSREAGSQCHILLYFGIAENVLGRTAPLGARRVTSVGRGSRRESGVTFTRGLLARVLTATLTAAASPARTRHRAPFGLPPPDRLRSGHDRGALWSSGVSGTARRGPAEALADRHLRLSSAQAKGQETSVHQVQRRSDSATEGDSGKGLFIDCEQLVRCNRCAEDPGSDRSPVRAPPLEGDTKE